jgi:hypothetical protein
MTKLAKKGKKVKLIDESGEVTSVNAAAMRDEDDPDLDRDEIIEETMPDGIDVADLDEPMSVPGSTKKKTSKISKQRDSAEIPEDGTGSLSA